MLRVARAPSQGRRHEPRPRAREGLREREDRNGPIDRPALVRLFAIRHWRRDRPVTALPARVGPARREARDLRWLRRRRKFNAPRVRRRARAASISIGAPILMRKRPLVRARLDLARRCPAPVASPSAAKVG